MLRLSGGPGRPASITTAFIGGTVLRATSFTTATSKAGSRAFIGGTMLRASSFTTATSKAGPRAVAAAAGAVRTGMEIDVGRVVPLLVANGTLRPDQAEGECVVEQFTHGQSNPTYKLTFGERQLVLRKQPPGKLLRGAHAVDREEKVMSALAHRASSVPVPRTRLFCEDAAVLGTPFMVQDFADGRLFRDAAMADAATPKERGELYGAFLKASAAIHTVDYKRVGLGGFGKEGGYVTRQTKVWSSQYRAAEMETIPAMEKLMAWLPEALPAGDDLTRLVHGDVRT